MDKMRGSLICLEVVGRASVKDLVRVSESGNRYPKPSKAETFACLSVCFERFRSRESRWDLSLRLGFAPIMRCRYLVNNFAKFSKRVRPVSNHLAAYQLLTLLSYRSSQPRISLARFISYGFLPQKWYLDVVQNMHLPNSTHLPIHAANNLLSPVSAPLPSASEAPQILERISRRPVEVFTIVLDFLNMLRHPNFQERSSAILRLCSGTGSKCSLPNQRAACFFSVQYLPSWAWFGQHISHVYLKI